MRPWIVAVAACSLFSCQDAKHGEKSPSPNLTNETVDAASAEKAAPAPEPAKAVPSPVTVTTAERTPREGWSPITLDDEVPLCFFASYEERGKVPVVEQVKKQTLKPNATVILGAFGPWCMNEACDTEPSLQCWIDPEGEDTFVVHTRMHTEHKTDSKCSKDCPIIAADCETPELKPGTYTFKYGAESRTVKIPSVVRTPCFSTPKK